MKRLSIYILFIFIISASVSSCTGDTDQPSQAEIEIEEYEDGGQYSGRLEEEKSTNN